MRWWRKKTEERAQWVLDPLVGVGPPRFGMNPDLVRHQRGYLLMDSIKRQMYGRGSLQLFRARLLLSS
ncbi:hypothetical protein [Streptomyces sp. NPDC047061]|uniref:hypothetical protein n=1 Tax=Streptomyces sp. NPDC047061 TaxID=3154605 RepID=UPI0033FEF844